ncbi:hypothetical protein [Nocardioides gansuensis]|nr:hypothetical protein [Nocardioides gansuensis]
MGNSTQGVAPPQLRVRDQARQAATLMAFSAVTSAAFATALLVLTRLGR